MMPLELSKSSRRAFEHLAADLTRIFGPRLVALVAFGPAASVAFASTLTADDLDACAALVETWHRERLAPPLVMTPDEFHRSLDTFPLEYAAMFESHVVIFGSDPFVGATVKRDDIRRACEVQARGLLIHLRQGWLEAAGHANHQAELVQHAAEPLRRLLSHVAQLEGARAETADDVTTFGVERLGLPADLLKAVLALETAPESARLVAKRLPELLSTAERLWLFVDTWRAR